MNGASLRSAPFTKLSRLGRFAVWEDIEDATLPAGRVARKRPAEVRQRRETRDTLRDTKERRRPVVVSVLKRNAAGHLPNTVRGSTDEEIWRDRASSRRCSRLDAWNLETTSFMAERHTEPGPELC